MSSEKKPDFMVIALIGGFFLLIFLLLIARSPYGAQIHAVGSTLSGIPAQEKPRNDNPFGRRTPPDFEKKTAAIKGISGLRNYTYYWFAPDLDGAPDDLSLPLVLVLHGGTGMSYAAGFLTEEKNRLAFPAFILTPMLSRGRLWAYPQDRNRQPPPNRFGLADIVRLIDMLADQHPIDRSRIYVIGCSDGGTGAFGAVRFFPDIFAGAVALSGHWHPPDAPNMTSVPLLAVHGVLDTVIAPENAEDTVTLIRSYGGRNAHYIEIPYMSHNCPSSELYQPLVWEWLFQQRKNRAAP